MSVIFYHYPKCNTCKKARRWLDNAGVSYTARHLVEDTPDVTTLRDLWQRAEVPVRKFFNTSGKSYRSGGFKDRLPHMSDDEALAALAADGMLIKRPLLDTGAKVWVGFKEAVYQDAVAKG